MNNSFQFDYDIFYNYYTTESNLETDPSPPQISYYPQTSSKISVQKQASNKFIRIDNKEIYITHHGQKEKKGLLFSLPPEENTLERWDDHFHFGIDDDIKIKNPITKKSKKITGVYFHKTVQHPEKGGGKELISCYFPPKMEINRDMKNFEEMKCLQRGNNMNQLYTDRDFHYLNEIISRPFLDKSYNTKISYSKALTSNKSNTQHHSSTHKNTKHSGNSPRGGTKKKKIRKYRRKSPRRR
jgi:hypothetical protein